MIVMIWSPINRLLPKPKNVIPPPPVPLCEGDKGGGASSVFRDMSKNIKPAPECFNQGTLDSRLKTAGMTILIKEVFSGQKHPYSNLPCYTQDAIAFRLGRNKLICFS